VGRLRERLPEGLADAVWLWLLLRVGMTLLAIVVVVEGRAAAPCPTDDHLRWLPGAGPAFPLLGAWHHWDACWYTTIASNGYGTVEGSGSTTFFPLLPWIAGTLAVVRDTIPWAFAVVNAVALIAALTGLHQLVARDVDAPTARRTTRYLVVFPTAFFLVAPFTEALFLAGVAWAFLGARTRRWEIVFVAGIVAGLARPLGLLLMLPLAWEAVMMVLDRWRAGGPRLRVGDIGVAVAVAAPGIAYVGFVAWTSLVVGQSYFEAHRGWGEHHLVLPWERLGEAIAYAFDRERPVQLLNAGVWMLFAGLTVAAIRLLPVAYWLFVLPQLVTALTQETVWPLMSTGRYALALFPCFVVLAIAGRNPRFHQAWLFLSTLLLAYFATEFVRGAMVG
jgi:hypothetical protein